MMPYIHKFFTYFQSLLLRRDEMTDQGIWDHLFMHPTLQVDFADVCLKANIPDFELLLKTNPNAIIASMGLACSKMAKTCRVQTGNHDSTRIYPPINVRIANYPNRTWLKDLKANVVGKFISVGGTVVRVSSIKPLVVQMAFLCSSCNKQFTIFFTDGKYKSPDRCGNGCKGKTFLPQRQSNSGTKDVDWQRIKVQEKLTDDQVDSGRVPRTIECELTRDLVDILIPGGYQLIYLDAVTISGVVKVLAAVEGKGKANQMYCLYVDANSVTKAGQMTEGDVSNSGSKDSLQFSDQDYEEFRQLYQDPNLFQLLVHSLCPAIFGHEIVKCKIQLT